MRPSLVAVAALCIASAAEAQAPTPAPSPAASPAAAASPAPPAAKPAPELQKLAFLAGDWTHAETWHPGPMGPGGKGAARSKTAWALGDHHLYVIYKTKGPLGETEGRGFIGWDPAAKAYRMDWFDSTGAATRYTGDFNADGALVLTGEPFFNGQRVKEQFTIKRQEDGKVLFTSSMAGPDGTMKVGFESLASAEARK